MTLIEDVWNMIPQYINKNNHINYEYTYDYEFKDIRADLRGVVLTITQRNVIVGQVKIYMGVEENESSGMDMDFIKHVIICEAISGVDEKSKTFKLPVITRFNSNITDFYERIINYFDFKNRISHTYDLYSALKTYIKGVKSDADIRS